MLLLSIFILNDIVLPIDVNNTVAIVVPCARFCGNLISPVKKGNATNEPPSPNNKLCKYTKLNALNFINYIESPTSEPVQPANVPIANAVTCLLLSTR